MTGRSFSKSPEIDFEDAYCSFQGQCIQEILFAIQDSEEIVKTYAYVVRGLAYFGQGQFEKALADYQKALELYPRPDIAYYYKGKALEKTGRPKEALTAYQKFLKTALPMHANQVREAKERIQKLKSPGL